MDNQKGDPMNTQFTQVARSLAKRGSITQFLCPTCNGNAWASRTQDNQLRAQCYDCGLVVEQASEGVKNGVNM